MNNEFDFLDEELKSTSSKSKSKDNKLKNKLKKSTLLISSNLIQYIIIGVLSLSIVINIILVIHIFSSSGNNKGSSSAQITQIDSIKKVKSIFEIVDNEKDDTISILQSIKDDNIEVDTKHRDTTTIQNRLADVSENINKTLDILLSVDPLSDDNVLRAEYDKLVNTNAINEKSKSAIYEWLKDNSPAKELNKKGKMIGKPIISYLSIDNENNMQSLAIASYTTSESVYSVNYLITSAFGKIVDVKFLTIGNQTNKDTLISSLSKVLAPEKHEIINETKKETKKDTKAKAKTKAKTAKETKKETKAKAKAKAKTKAKTKTKTKKETTKEKGTMNE